MIGQILAAIAFLTRIPVPTSTHTRAMDLGRSARWFPAVGLLLGSLYAVFAWIALLRLPASVVAVLVVALDALLTGALHLDGLADMADGFGGGKTRGDVLRIMRDHSIGSYGAVALILALLTKAVCLSSLLGKMSDFWILFTAPAISRWSILLLSTSVPYAREINDGPIGTGAMSRFITWRDLLFGTALCLPLLLFPGPVRTLIYWAASAVCTACLARMCQRRIGGFTGDVLGANTVLSEALQFVIAIVVSQA